MARAAASLPCLSPSFYPTTRSFDRPSIAQRRAATQPPTVSRMMPSNMGSASRIEPTITTPSPGD